MLWISVKRIFKSGFTSFFRNSFVSLAAIFVMTMTVFIIGSLMFLNGMVGQFVTYVKDKVDVNVYFVPDASDEAVFDLTDSIKSLPEVDYVTYVSRDEVLQNFRARHEGDQLTLQALDELGENPFGATLSIKAKEPSQYEGIAQFLDDHMADSAGAALVDEVNFENNRLVIERLERIASYAELFGYVVITLFAFASVLITFNTIRLAIYTAREEISVMRLVGASNGYIRGPFIVEGTLYGAIAGVISLVLFLLLSFLARTSTVEAFGFDILDMYISDFLVFFVVLIGSGMLLGAISSFLAVRKYLSI